MVFTIPALVAMAASLPTGLGFGAGYGAGVRLGYDVLYPALQPYAMQFVKGIMGAVSNVWGGDSKDAPIDVFPQSDNPQLPFDPKSGGGRTGTAADIPVDVPSEGRRVGASDLKSAVSDVSDTVANPFTRTEIVYFGNYKRNANKIATASSSNQYAKRVTWIPALARAKSWIDSNSSMDRYYDWLTR